MGQCCCNFVSQREKDRIAERTRREALHAGAKFMRNDTYLGLTSKELWVRLSNDTALLAWRTTGTGSWTAAEFGEVDLTSQVTIVRSHGLQGIQFLDSYGKVVFDVQAEDTVVRDQWVLGLSELLYFWKMHPEAKPAINGSAGEKYARETELDSQFKQREAEFLKSRESKLAAREAAALARKQKYQIAGGKTYASLASQLND